MNYDALLSNKPVNLNAPGTKYTGIYYSRDNSAVEVIQSTYNFSQKISLSSRQFGSSNSIVLPNSQFLSTVMLRLRLPVPVANQSIARGWGIRMIRTLQYQLGSASTTPVILTGEGIFQFLMSQCDSRVKRSQMLRFCGEQYTVVPVPPLGGAPPIVEAYIPLPLPFSSLCGKLPLDTSLLSQPVSITIDFEENARCIYGGSAAVPTAFLEADLVLRQQALDDASKSLRNVMMANPALIHAYPMIMAVEHAVPGTFTGSVSSSSPVIVPFNSFQNADLLGISFRVAATTDYSPTGNNSPNPFHCERLRDIVIKYNGGILAQYPGESYIAADAYLPDQHASGWEGSIIAAGTTTPFGTSPTDEYLVYIDFTRLRAACYHDMVENTWRIPPGGQLEVSFTTPRDDVTYLCRYTAYYNAVADIQFGSTSILTA
jgi:hypothetical protein